MHFDKKEKICIFAEYSLLDVVNDELRGMRCNCTFFARDYI